LWRLESHARGIDIPLPTGAAGWPVPRLQRFEDALDALDALVCAWMATEFLAGKLRPL
jgi:hypothetical protein